MYVLTVIILLNSFGFCQPYLRSDPPKIEEGVIQYYIKHCTNIDTNKIDPNCYYTLMIPRDPNAKVYIEDEYSDPNFFVEAVENGSLNLNLKNIKRNLPYTLMIHACSKEVCGAPSLVYFVAQTIPHEVRGLTIIEKEFNGCNIGKMFYIIIK
jgi:hypothetical protein